jgi:hypothetical protein
VLRPAQRLVALFIVHETHQVENRKEHPFLSFLIQVSLYSGPGSVWFPCASTFSTLALRSSVLVYFDVAVQNLLELFQNADSFPIQLRTESELASLGRALIVD